MEDSRILSVKNVYNALNKAGTVGVSVSLPDNSGDLPATEQHVSDILQIPLNNTERSDYQICYKNMKSLIDFSKKSRYQRVEYIENNGSQFVDTDFKPSNLTSYVLDMQLVNPRSNENHFFSVRDSTTYFILRLSTNRTAFNVRWGTSNLKILPHSGNLTDRHIITCDKGTFQCDDAEPVTLNSSGFTLSQPVSLFAVTNANGNRTNHSFSKIYSLKIYENGILVRDMVPCYDTQTNLRGFYDFVRKVFTANGGTGAFTLGPQLGYIISPN